MCQADSIIIKTGSLPYIEYNMSAYNNDKVSVVIPVYNLEKHIGTAIDSVLAQNYKDFEIILVDDCSSDRSADIIASYVEKYPNIIYHKQPRNGGAAVARNTAIQLAGGRYIAFLDGDDVWCHDKLEKQLSFMKSRNAAISCTALDTIDESGYMLGKRRSVIERISYHTILHNTMIATSTVIVDRNLTGDFQMPLRRGGQDYATWLMLMRNGTICYGLNEVLSHYRLTSNSLSSNKFKSIRQVWEIQTQNEGVNRLHASFNIIRFVLNAVLKRI